MLAKFPENGEVELLEPVSGKATSVQAITKMEKYQGVAMPAADDLDDFDSNKLKYSDSMIDQSEPIEILVEAQAHRSEVDILVSVASNSKGNINQNFAEFITKDLEDISVLQECVTENARTLIRKAIWDQISKVSGRELDVPMKTRMIMANGSVDMIEGKVNLPVTIDGVARICELRIATDLDTEMIPGLYSQGKFEMMFAS